MLLELGLLAATHFFYPLWRPGVVKIAASFSPALETLLNHALSWTDPVKLEKMADAFEKAGHKDEAEQLRDRAKLRAHPKEELQEWSDVIKKALVSTKPDAIRDVARAFKRKGATNIADMLEQYAIGLQTLTKVPPVILPAGALGAGSPAMAMSPESLAQPGANPGIPPMMPVEGLQGEMITPPLPVSPAPMVAHGEGLQNGQRIGIPGAPPQDEAAWRMQQVMRGGVTI